MKLHKHFPPYLAQLVFMNKDGIIKKITSLDYDLFLWLIYNTHKQYSKDSSLYFEFTYKDVKDSFSKSMNTDKIKSSLKKLGELTLYCNILQSYADKEKIRIKPFEIEIITATNNISYGFSVKTSQEFMEWFNNPSPKVDVNYDIIYTLKPTMAKLLYLFLRDANGAYKNTLRKRNVDIQNLRHMMNIYDCTTTNSNFITQLKKSIETINKKSDIDVGYKVVKKRNLKSGISEITEIKFTIKLNENKQFEQKVQEKPSQNVASESDEKYGLEDYINERVDEAYQEAVENGVNIKKINSYKNGIKKQLIADGIESDYKLLVYLEEQKEIVRNSVPDNQAYRIIHKDENNPYSSFSFTNEGLIETIVDKKILTNSIDETIEYLQITKDILNFTFLKSSYAEEYNLSRL